MDKDSKIKLAGWLGIAAGISLLAGLGIVWWQKIVWFGIASIKWNYMLVFDPYFDPFALLSGIFFTLGGCLILHDRKWGRFLLVSTSCLITFEAFIYFLIYGFFIYHPSEYIGVGWSIVILFELNTSTIRDALVPVGKVRTLEKWVYISFGFLAAASVASYFIVVHLLFLKTGIEYSQPQKIILDSKSNKQIDDKSVERRLFYASLKLPPDYAVSSISKYSSEDLVAEGVPERFIHRNDYSISVRSHGGSILMMVNNNSKWEDMITIYPHNDTYKMVVRFVSQKIGLLFHTLKLFPRSDWAEIVVGDWRGFRETFSLKEIDRQMYIFSLWHRPTGKALEITVIRYRGESTLEDMQKIVSTLQYTAIAGTSETYAAAGNELVKEGRLEDAKYEYVNALYLDWNNPDYHYQLSKSALATGHPCSALNQLDDILKLKTDYPGSKELREKAKTACDKKILESEAAEKKSAAPGKP